MDIKLGVIELTRNQIARLHTITFQSVRGFCYDMSSRELTVVSNSDLPLPALQELIARLKALPDSPISDPIAQIKAKPDTQITLLDLIFLLRAYGQL